MDDDVEQFIGTSIADRLFQNSRPQHEKVVGVTWAEGPSIVVWRGNDLKAVILRRRGPDPHTVERCGARSSRLPRAVRMDVMKPFLRHEVYPHRSRCGRDARPYPLYSNQRARNLHFRER